MTDIKKPMDSQVTFKLPAPLVDKVRVYKAKLEHRHGVKVPMSEVFRSLLERALADVGRAR